MTKKHLWEVEHDYYCERSNFYARDTQAHYKNIAAFIEAEGDADMDRNLVFRFDWLEGEGWDLPEYNGDDYYRNGLLCIFFMGQRKGLFRCATVEVCRADEPAVLAYLQPRWENMRQLWEPLS